MGMTIKQWRRFRDMTQEQLASLMNVHPNTIADWEKSPSKIPLGKAFEICNKLGVAFDDVIFLPENSANM